LLPFQVVGSEWLASRQRGLLADEMGLGKTVQTLMALPHQARAVIVCPKSVRGVWADEILRWRSDLEPVLEPAAPAPGQAVITTYRSAVRVPERPGYTVVADEAQNLGNPSSQQSKAFRALSARARHCWLLSGTPMTDHPWDLWGALHAARMERMVFDSFSRFVDLYGGVKDEWGKWQWTVPEGPEVSLRLCRVMLRRTKAEVLPQLPAKRRDYVYTELDGQLSRAWDCFGADSTLSLASGELPTQAATWLAREVALSRIPAMLALVADAERHGIPLVVFSAHRAPIETLERRSGWGAIHGSVPEKVRRERVQLFQAGRLLGVGVTIGAGGTGLTLTRAQNALFVDRSYTPADNVQAEDRLARIGQRGEVLIRIFTSAHPVEKRVNEILDLKERIIESSVGS
jgi:SNF2 family DNA or RNA helicase